MKKLLNKIGLGNLALIMWLLVLPTIAIAITCYTTGWLFSKEPPSWFSLLAAIYSLAYLILFTRYVVYNIVLFVLTFLIISLEYFNELIKKMNRTKLAIIVLFLFGGMLQAQVCKDYSCSYQGKQYVLSMGVFSPNDDGSIVIKKEKPDGEWSLKSYDFYSYTPMGLLFTEKGNSDKKVIIEKDLRNINITSITFLSTEEKVVYKPISK